MSLDIIEDHVFKTDIVRFHVTMSRSRTVSDIQFNSRKAEWWSYDAMKGIRRCIYYRFDTIHDWRTKL